METARAVSGDIQTLNDDLLSESSSEPISGTEIRQWMVRRNVQKTPGVLGIRVSPTKCE